MPTTDDQDRTFGDLAVEHLSAACALRPDGSLLASFDRGAREVVIHRDGDVLSDTTCGDVLREGAWS